MNHGSKHASASDKNEIKSDTAGASSPHDAHRRSEAVQFALDLHRGKDRPAADIVAEAAVFETYLRDGAPVPAPEAKSAA